MTPPPTPTLDSNGPDVFERSGTSATRNLFGLGYETFIARRYLWSRPRRSFISLISIISVLGVMVGVWVLTITLSAMNGFEDEVRSKIVGTNAHIVLLTRRPQGLAEYEDLARRLEEIPGVLGTSPILYTKGMLSLGHRADGVVVKGVDLAREALVTDVPSYIVPEIESIDDAAFTDLPGIVLGFEVALRLSAGVGDTVKMSSPMRTVRTPLGDVPLVERFEVVGLFHCGMYEYDSSFCFISVPAAQEYLEGCASPPLSLPESTRASTRPESGIAPSPPASSPIGRRSPQPITSKTTKTMRRLCRSSLLLRGWPRFSSPSASASLDASASPSLPRRSAKGSPNRPSGAALGGAA